jgi:hypothetical protein
MNDSITIALKIVFLLGFTIHNIEESIWLPEWSKHAKKFHETVERNQFIFAVIVVTIIGYLVTVAEILTNNPGSVFTYIYLGFIGMMGLNTFLPHLTATILLKKYAPGLITAILLNLPLSLIIISRYIAAGVNVYFLIIAILVFTTIILALLKPLFKLGDKLVRY